MNFITLKVVHCASCDINSSWLVDYALEGLYTSACAFEIAAIVSEILVPSNHALKCVGGGEAS